MLQKLGFFLKAIAQNKTVSGIEDFFYAMLILSNAYNAPSCKIKRNQAIFACYN